MCLMLHIFYNFKSMAKETLVKYSGEEVITFDVGDLLGSEIEL